MHAFRSLRHRPFALLWAGQTISRIGDSLQTLALTWFLVEKTGSATAISGLFVALFVPNLIFLLLGGVAVDRLPRLGVMLASDLLRGLLVGLIAALAYVGRLDVWHLYAMAIVFGFVDAFFQPAYIAALPDLTPAELLPSANALTSLGGRTVAIAGPAIAALLIQLGGTSFAFAIDALSFVVSGACLVPLLRSTQRAAPARHAGGVLSEIGVGLRAVGAQPWLWVTIAIFSLVNVTQGGPLAVALPLLIRNTLRSGVDLLGLFSSMSACGAVLTALWLGRATTLRHRGRLAYGGALLSGLMTLALGLPIGVPGVLLSGFLLGVGLTVFGLIWTNTLQELVPRVLLGRVSSVDQLGSFALLPVGYALTGWATDRIGPMLVFVVGGALTCTMIGLGLLHPAVRRLD